MSLKSAPVHLYWVIIEQAKKLGENIQLQYTAMNTVHILYVEVLGWVAGLVIASTLVFVTPTLRMMNVQQYEFDGNDFKDIPFLSFSKTGSHVDVLVVTWCLQSHCLGVRIKEAHTSVSCCYVQAVTFTSTCMCTFSFLHTPRQCGLGSLYVVCLCRAPPVAACLSHP